MASMAALNYRLTRAFHYPPTFFAILWAALLFGLYISGDFFYQISVETLTIFSLGVFMFSIGGLLVSHIYHNKPVNNLSYGLRDTSFTDRFLDIGLVVLLLAFPFYWRLLQQLGTMSGIEDFWIGLRAQTGSGDKSEAGLGIFSYLTAFSTFISWAAYYENDGTLYKRFRAYFLITISITYHALTVSRLGVMVTIFGIIGVTIVRFGKIRVRSMLIGIVTFVLVFSIPAIILNKGGSLDNDLSENAVSLLESFQLYTLGGLVAFNDVVASPDYIKSNWSSLRFFATIANLLGSNFNLSHSTILDYTFTPRPTNVYTIYFPYYQDYGWAGIAIIMLVLGGLTTGIYTKAINRDPQAAVLYGLIFAGLMLSSFGEFFMTALSYWIQAIFFTFLLYKLPLLLKRYKFLPNDT